MSGASRLFGNPRLDQRGRPHVFLLCEPALQLFTPAILCRFIHTYLFTFSLPAHFQILGFNNQPLTFQ